MKQSALEMKITGIVEPVVQDMGLALVCVRMIGEGGSRNLQIMAENPQTRRLGVEDCAKLSRAISAVLDVEDPISGAFRLEISSPGIDRPLVREQDYVDFTGLEARVETDMPDANGQKRYRGFLRGVREGNVLLETENGEAIVPYHAIARGKLILTDALLKASAPGPTVTDPQGIDEQESERDDNETTSEVKKGKKR